MNAAEIKNEIAMGLKLVAYKPVKLEIAPMSVVEEAMKESDWHSISSIAGDGLHENYRRYYYNTATKTYALLSCSGYTGASSISAVEEHEVLDSLTFPELKALGNMLDKKSVAFITTYSRKEMESAGSEAERQALNERNQKMIDEAEVALRKR